MIGYRKVRREQWRRRAHHTLMISGARQHDSLAIDDGSNPIRPHPLPPHDGEKIVGVPAVTKDIAEFALADDRHVDVEYRAFGDEADEQIGDLALLGFDHAPRGFRIPGQGWSFLIRHVSVHELTQRAVDQNDVAVTLQSGLCLRVKCGPVGVLQRRQGRERIKDGEVSLDVAVDILGQIVGELNQTRFELITLERRRADEQHSRQSRQRQDQDQSERDQMRADRVATAQLPPSCHDTG